MKINQINERYYPYFMYIYPISATERSYHIHTSNTSSNPIIAKHFANTDRASLLSTATQLHHTPHHVRITSPAPIYSFLNAFTPLTCALSHPLRTPLPPRPPSNLRHRCHHLPLALMHDLASPRTHLDKRRVVVSAAPLSSSLQ